MLQCWQPKVRLWFSCFSPLGLQWTLCSWEDYSYQFPMKLICLTRYYVTIRARRAADSRGEAVRAWRKSTNCVRGLFGSRKDADKNGMLPRWKANCPLSDRDLLLQSLQAKTGSGHMTRWALNGCANSPPTAHTELLWPVPKSTSDQPFRHFQLNKLWLESYAHTSTITHIVQLTKITFWWSERLFHSFIVTVETQGKGRWQMFNPNVYKQVIIFLKYLICILRSDIKQGGATVKMHSYLTTINRQVCVTSVFAYSNKHVCFLFQINVWPRILKSIFPPLCKTEASPPPLVSLSFSLPLIHTHARKLFYDHMIYFTHKSG